jgi:hypothetical protein
VLFALIVAGNVFEAPIAVKLALRAAFALGAPRAFTAWGCFVALTHVAWTQEPTAERPHSISSGNYLPICGAHSAVNDSSCIRPNEHPVFMFPRTPVVIGQVLVPTPKSIVSSGVMTIGLIGNSVTLTWADPPIMDPAPANCTCPDVCKQ